MPKLKGNKLVNLNGLPLKEDTKPAIMLGRPIAREPMWENQIKFQSAFLQLAAEGYGVYQEDLDSLNWWLKHHSSNRNWICRTFLERKDCDYLIFIDDDMTFMNLAEDIKKMIALDKDMVMGICSCKPSPHFPNLGKFTELGTSGTIMDSISRHIYTFPEDKPFEVDFGSMGLVCIKRKVIENMESPYCYFPPNYSTGNVFGEDVTFFFNAKMLGYELWVDPTIKLGHLGYTAWNYKDRADHWLDHKDKLIKEAEEEGWDYSHNLVPEVQTVFKQGKGSKRLI
jgi:hypothetical protein